jgi:uncharacterized repeat protein (TIGR03943 family)
VFAGAAVVRLAAVDSIARHPVLRSYVFVLGAAMAVLAAAGLLDEVRRSRTTPDSRRAWPRALGAMAWLLTIPVAVTLAVAPTGSAPATVRLSADASLPVYAMVYPRLPDGDPVRMSVVDYVTRMRSDTGGSLIGRQVELTGYLAAVPGGRWDLRRAMITCCSPRPWTFAVRLVGALPAGVGPGAWLRVTGGLPPGVDAARPAGAAFLSILSATVIPAPSDPVE